MSRIEDVLEDGGGYWNAGHENFDATEEHFPWSLELRSFQVAVEANKLEKSQMLLAPVLTEVSSPMIEEQNWCHPVHGTLVGGRKQNQSIQTSTDAD